MKKETQDTAAPVYVNPWRLAVDRCLSGTSSQKCKEMLQQFLSNELVTIQVDDAEISENPKDHLSFIYSVLYLLLYRTPIILQSNDIINLARKVFYKFFPIEYIKEAISSEDYQRCVSVIEKLLKREPVFIHGVKIQYDDEILRKALKEPLLTLIESGKNDNGADHEKSVALARDLFDKLFLPEIISILEIRFEHAMQVKDVSEISRILEELTQEKIPHYFVGNHTVRVTDKMIEAIKVPLWNFCMKQILKPTPERAVLVNLSRNLLIQFFSLGKIKEMYEIEFFDLIEAKNETTDRKKEHLFLVMRDLVNRYSRIMNRSEEKHIELMLNVYGQAFIIKDSRAHFEESEEVANIRWGELGALERCLGLDYMIFYLETHVELNDLIFEKWLMDSIGRMLSKNRINLKLDGRDLYVRPEDLVNALNAHPALGFAFRSKKYTETPNFRNENITLFYWILDLISKGKIENLDLVKNGIQFFTKAVYFYLFSNRASQADILFSNLTSLFKLLESDLSENEKLAFRHRLKDIESSIESETNAFLETAFHLFCIQENLKLLSDNPSSHYQMKLEQFITVFLMGLLRENKVKELRDILNVGYTFTYQGQLQKLTLSPELVASLRPKIAEFTYQNQLQKLTLSPKLAAALQANILNMDNINSVTDAKPHADVSGNKGRYNYYGFYAAHGSQRPEFINNLIEKKDYAKLFKAFYDKNETNMMNSDFPTCRFHVGLFLIDALCNGEFQVRRSFLSGFFKTKSSPFVHALAICDDLLEKTLAPQSECLLHCMAYELSYRFYFDDKKDSVNLSNGIKLEKAERLQYIIRRGHIAFENLLKVNSELPLEQWVKQFDFEPTVKYMAFLSLYSIEANYLHRSSNPDAFSAERFIREIIQPVSEKMREFLAKSTAVTADVKLLDNISLLMKQFSLFEARFALEADPRNQFTEYQNYLTSIVPGA
ncbi:MAG: hypothetical protein JSS53_07030 [Proteobacteria bacterium]|nr:hypothetical protein [Pseudomonadota bacterium]